MKIFVKYTCIILALCSLLCLGSCGSKKTKLRAEMSTAALTSNDDVFEEQTTTEPDTTSADQVIIMKKHRYEFYNYGNITYKGMLNYQEYYAKKYYQEYKTLKNYLVAYFEKNGKPGQELIYKCLLQKDGSRAYSDENGNAVTDETVLAFFKAHNLVSAIRYSETSGEQKMYADFFTPSFVGDLDYNLTCSMMFSSIENENTLKGYDDTLEVRKINEGWFYIAQQNKSVRIRITD